jgi:hypothetical protein
MAITLNIVNNLELDDEYLYNLTDDLRHMIDDETDISPQLVTTEGRQGTKAVDIITIGTVALTAFSAAGSIIELTRVFKAYFNREPSLELNLKDEKGMEIKINAKNLDSKKVQQLLDQLFSDDEQKSNTKSK